MLLVGVIISLLLSLPSLAFSGLAVYPSGARHCVLDLGGVGAGMGLPTSDLQLPTAIYYLVLRALLPYWVPLLMLPLMWKSMNSKLGSSAVISLALLISYFLHLFRPLTALVLEPSLRSSLTASPYLPVLEVEPRDKSNPTI